MLRYFIQSTLTHTPLCAGTFERNLKWIHRNLSKAFLLVFGSIFFALSVLLKQTVFVHNQFTLQFGYKKFFQLHWANISIITLRWPTFFFLAKESLPFNVLTSVFLKLIEHISTIISCLTTHSRKPDDQAEQI